MPGSMSTTPSGRTRRWGCGPRSSGSSSLRTARPVRCRWLTRSPPRRSPAFSWRCGCMGCSGGSTSTAVISLAGFSYRVPIVLAAEPVEAVVADHLVQGLPPRGAGR